MSRQDQSYDPKLQNLTDEWALREKLEPFWAEAQRRVQKKVGPPSEPPRPEQYGLIPADIHRLPKDEPHSPKSGVKRTYKEIMWFFCVVVIEYVAAFVIVSHLTSLDTFGTALSVLLLGTVPFSLFNVVLLPFGPKWMSWAEQRWWDKSFPRWRSYAEARALFEQEEDQYRKTLWSITFQEAERLLGVARKEEDYWRKLSGIEFERELGRLFEHIGYIVESTPYTADQGVDLKLTKDGKLTVVQCKAHKTKISIGTARELYASMIDFNADEAIIASFEGITGPVAEYIKTRSIRSLTLDGILLLQKSVKPSLSGKHSAILEAQRWELLIGMTRQERLKKFAELVGPEIAQLVNTRFETGVLLPFQKAALLQWVNRPDAIQDRTLRTQIANEISAAQEALSRREVKALVWRAYQKLARDPTSEDCRSIFDSLGKWMQFAVGALARNKRGDLYEYAGRLWSQYIISIT